MPRLPIGNRRYGRLETCATSPNLRPRALMAHHDRLRGLQEQDRPDALPLQRPADPIRVNLVLSVVKSLLPVCYLAAGHASRSNAPRSHVYLASPMSLWIHDVSSGHCSRHAGESRCFLKGIRLLFGPFWRRFLHAAGESQNPNILPLTDRNSTTNCGFRGILERNNYCP